MARTITDVPPGIPQSPRDILRLADDLSLEAAALVRRILPRGRKLHSTPCVSPTGVSRARSTGGPLAGTARFLLAAAARGADREDLEAVVAWLSIWIECWYADAPLDPDARMREWIEARMAEIAAGRAAVAAAMRHLGSERGLAA